MFKACRFPSGGSVVVAVLLLCLGFSLILLSLPARGSQDPSALGMDNVLPVDQVANVNAPSLDGTYYPFALAEEADEDPVSAGSLTMLLLAASFLGGASDGCSPTLRGKEHCASPAWTLVRCWATPVRTTYPS
jgi:hypothetical protein